MYNNFGLQWVNRFFKKLKTRMVTLTLTWHQPACSSQISYGVVKLDDGELKCHDEAYYFKVVV